MKSAGGMVSHQMITELFLRLQYEFRDYPAALTELWWTVGLPSLVGLAIAALLGVLILRIKRAFFMTPTELHREALTLLGDHGSLRDVEQLLRRAVRQKNYIPARTSLAALYTYRMDRPDDALELLSTKNVMPSGQYPLSLDERGILLDAQAIKAGNGHMILAELQALEFLSLAYADVVGPSSLEQQKSALPTDSKKDR